MSLDNDALLFTFRYLSWNWNNSAQFTQFSRHNERRIQKSSAAVFIRVQQGCWRSECDPSIRCEWHRRQDWNIFLPGKIIRKLSEADEWKSELCHFQVSLRVKNLHNCGASILNELWVLTVRFLCWLLKHWIVNVTLTGSTLYSLARSPTIFGSVCIDGNFEQQPERRSSRETYKTWKTFSFESIHKRHWTGEVESFNGHFVEGVSSEIASFKCVLSDRNSRRTVRTDGTSSASIETECDTESRWMNFSKCDLLDWGCSHGNTSKSRSPCLFIRGLLQTTNKNNSLHECVAGEDINRNVRVSFYKNKLTIIRAKAPCLYFYRRWFREA